VKLVEAAREWDRSTSSVTAFIALLARLKNLLHEADAEHHAKCVTVTL
jgi:hypothetical protein